MAMTIELKPCPFCGKEGPFDQWPCEWLDGKGSNVIRCPYCHGAAPMATWNRRAHLSQPAQAVDVGAIREVIEEMNRSYSGADYHWIDKLTRALSAEKAGCLPWISVEDKLPEPCKFVLASYLNANGKGRVIRAMYAAPKTLELHMDAEGGEYDEETDTYWCEPGWYEANENEEAHWFVAEKVTHWMPLPASPTPDKEG